MSKREYLSKKLLVLKIILEAQKEVKIISFTCLSNLYVFIFLGVT